MEIFRENDVAIYCSKLSKCEISIEEQLQHLKKYCKHFGLNIVKEYIDTDNVNKPLFNQMIEDIKTKAFNIVLSYSLDTLTKDEDDLHRLVNELYKYDYELQLESSYKYKIISRPLFKLPRNDNAKQEKEAKKKEKGKAKCYPMSKKIRVKNPKSDNPYNWVELLDEDRYSFEETPIFDDEGNYLGVRKDVYVIFDEITGFCRINQSKEEKERIKLVQRKLF